MIRRFIVKLLNHSIKCLEEEREELSQEEMERVYSILDKKNQLAELNESELNLVIQAVHKAKEEQFDFAITQKGDAYKIAMERAKAIALALEKLYNARRNYRLQSKL